MFDQPLQPIQSASLRQLATWVSLQIMPRLASRYTRLVSCEVIFWRIGLICIAVKTEQGSRGCHFKVGHQPGVVSPGGSCQHSQCVSAKLSCARD